MHKVGVLSYSSTRRRACGVFERVRAHLLDFGLLKKHTYDLEPPWTRTSGATKIEGSQRFCHVSRDDVTDCFPQNEMNRKHLREEVELDKSPNLRQ